MGAASALLDSLPVGWTPKGNPFREKSVLKFETGMPTITEMGRFELSAAADGAIPAF
jgi:hypothetical protein